MLAYTYNEEDGRYMCTVEQQIDPLTTEITGITTYLMPGSSTDVEPPTFDKETQNCIWKGDHWEIEDLPQVEPINPEDISYALTDKQMANAIRSGTVI